MRRRQRQMCIRDRLYPNNSQKTLLAKHAGVARHAWNWGLWLTRNIRPL